MSTQEIITEDTAEELLKMKEDDLQILLEGRIIALHEDPSLSLRPSFGLETNDLEAIKAPRWLQRTVEEMINTALRQTYNVVCSNDPDFKQLRDQLLAALGLGGTAAVIAFTTFLTSTVGLAVAIASVIATIIIKKIGLKTIEAGHKVMCEELGKLVPEP